MKNTSALLHKSFSISPLPLNWLICTILFSFACISHFSTLNNYVQVVKKPGVIIKPIEFKEVNPHENKEEHKWSGQKQKMKKGKSDGSIPRKKMKKADGKTNKVN